MNSAMKSFALVALALTSTTALAGTGDHVKESKRWYEPSFVFEVSAASSKVEREALLNAGGAAAAVWNEVGVGPEVMLVASKGKPVDHPVALDGVNRIGVWADGPWPYHEMAGAATLVYSRKGDDQIAEVDIALNPAFGWTLDPLDDEGKYDLENVMAHEIGHALGLPDVKDLQDATMFYMVLRGETLKRDLSEEDTAMLLELYEGIEASEPTTGCSQAGTQTPTAAIALLSLLAAMRARRRA